MKNDQMAEITIRQEDLKEITLKDLADNCSNLEHRGGCLKCDYVLFCNQYLRYMHQVAPRWWLELEKHMGYDLDDLILAVDSYRVVRHKGEK